MGGRSEHKVRNTILGLLFIIVLLRIFPDLGASHNVNASALPSCDVIQYDGTPYTCHYDGDLPGVPSVVHSLQETVVARNGYDSGDNCWILVIREIDRPDIHGTHCVSKEVYDRFPIGSIYNG